MSENFYKVLTNKIITNIPENKKPVAYLMDILNIGRESTYRRLRGNIPFTFEEIIKLSQCLNFSIDEIIGNDAKNIIFFPESKHKKPSDFDDIFYKSHLNYYNILEMISKAKEIDILFSVSQLTSFLIFDFELLFKFYYYTCIHQSDSGKPKFSFSNIELPQDIVSIRQKIKSNIASIPNTTYIFDQHVTMRLIRKLQYFYKRNLISYDELEAIRNDVIRFLDYIENLFQTGTNSAGTASNFYLSLLDIDMNSMYGTYDDSIVSLYWTYNINSVNIGNNDLIAMHKNWINSLKRSSIMISQSNEIVQASFLNLQRENIDKITTDTFYYYG